MNVIRFMLSEIQFNHRGKGGMPQSTQRPSRVLCENLCVTPWLNRKSSPFYKVEYVEHLINLSRPRFRWNYLFSLKIFNHE